MSKPQPPFDPDEPQEVSLAALAASGKISPQDLQKLEDREKALDAEEASEDSDTIEVPKSTLRIYSELETQAHALRSDKAALTSQNQALQAQLDALRSLIPHLATESPESRTLSEFERLKPLLSNRCRPTIIGGSDPTAIPPSSWDMTLTSEPDPQTRFACGIQTVWIPVRIYPTAVIPKDRPSITLKSGLKIQNRVIGQTQIRESHIFPSLIGRDGVPYPVAITAFATVNIHGTKTPSDILAQQDRNSSLLASLDYQDDSDLPLHLLADPSSSPPFIPSHASPPNPNFNRSNLNPSSSPSHPFHPTRR